MKQYKRTLERKVTETRKEYTINPKYSQYTKKITVLSCLNNDGNIDSRVIIESISSTMRNNLNIPPIDVSLGELETLRNAFDIAIELVAESKTSLKRYT